MSAKMHEQRQKERNSAQDLKFVEPSAATTGDGTVRSSESPAEQATDGDLVGQTIMGAYLILEKIGSGGMGVVYKAKHLHLQDLVAIKVISPDRSVNEKDIARFRREARAASALSHPNIVAYREFNIDESGRAFIVMQLAEGQSLEDKLEREKVLSPAYINQMATDV